MNGVWLALGTVAAVAAAGVVRGDALTALPERSGSSALVPFTLEETSWFLPYEAVPTLLDRLDDWTEYEFYSLLIDPRDRRLQTGRIAERRAARYVEHFRTGVGVPPVVVLERHEGGVPSVEVLDGHHRIAAARRAGLPHIEALVGRRKGEAKRSILRLLGVWT